MLPTITHLQAAILKQLRDSPLAGVAVRIGLCALGIKKEGPAFYQLMARMEEAGLIDSRKTPLTVGDQRYHECHYKITAKGRKELERTEEFYER